MIPLGLSGGLQVMFILKKEGSGVMTTGPGAGWRGGLDPKMTHIHCQTLTAF